MFDEPVRQILSEAAQAKGLADEIGALRFALARLVGQEEDPTKLALGVSRVANATVRAMKAQRGLGSQQDLSWEEFVDVVAVRWGEMQAEIESGEYEEYEKDDPNWPTNAEVMAKIAAEGHAGYEEIFGKSEQKEPAGLDKEE